MAPKKSLIGKGEEDASSRARSRSPGHARGVGRHEGPASSARAPPSATPGYYGVEGGVYGAITDARGGREGAAAGARVSEEELPHQRNQTQAQEGEDLMRDIAQLTGISLSTYDVPAEDEADVPLETLQEDQDEIKAEKLRIAALPGGLPAGAPPGLNPILTALRGTTPPSRASSGSSSSGAPKPRVMFAEDPKLETRMSLKARLAQNAQHRLESSSGKSFKDMVMGQFRQGQSPASAQEASGDVVSQVARDGAVGDTLADEEDKSAGAFRTAGRSLSQRDRILAGDEDVVSATERAEQKRKLQSKSEAKLEAKSKLGFISRSLKALQGQPLDDSTDDTTDSDADTPSFKVKAVITKSPSKRHSSMGASLSGAVQQAQSIILSPFLGASVSGRTTWVEQGAPSRNASGANIAQAVSKLLGPSPSSEPKPLPVRARSSMKKKMLESLTQKVASRVLGESTMMTINAHREAQFQQPEGKSKGVAWRLKERKALEKAKPFVKPVVTHLHAKVDTVKESQYQYNKMLVSVSWFFFYLTVLLSLSASVTKYEQKSALLETMKPTGAELALLVSPTNGFYAWLGDRMNTIFTDPRCGNGMCEGPYEFPAYETIGCESDCGQETDLQAVVVQLQADFSLAPSVLDAMAVMSSASWNVCEDSDERAEAGLEDVCLFEEDEGFQSIQNIVQMPFNLKRGIWYVRISGDHLGLLDGKVLLVNDDSSLEIMPTDPPWDTCPPLELPVSPPPEAPISSGRPPPQRKLNEDMEVEVEVQTPPPPIPLARLPPQPPFADGNDTSAAGMANSSAPAGEGARRQLRAWRDSLGSVRERLAVQFETDARGTTLHGNQNSTSNTSRFEGNDAASGPPSLRAMYSGSMETEAAAVRGGQGAFAAVARRSVLQKESPRQPAWEDDYFMPCNSTCACVKGGAIRFGVPGNWHYKSASGLPVDCATATTPPSLRAAMPASASCQCSTKAWKVEAMDASQGFLAGSFLNESDVDGLGIDAISFVGQNNSNASLADASAVATYYLRCVESTSVQFSAIVSTPSYASNSFFVTVDDYQVPAQWELHDSTSGLDATWRVDASWDAPEFFLHAGHHAVSVFGRETGARLAAIGLPAYSACYWIDKSDVEPVAHTVTAEYAVNGDLSGLWEVATSAGVGRVARTFIKTPTTAPPNCDDAVCATPADPGSVAVFNVECMYPVSTLWVKAIVTTPAKATAAPPSMFFQMDDDEFLVWELGDLVASNYDPVGVDLGVALSVSEAGFHTFKLYHRTGGVNLEAVGMMHNGSCAFASPAPPPPPPSPPPYAQDMFPFGFQCQFSCSAKSIAAATCPCFNQACALGVKGTRLQYKQVRPPCLRVVLSYCAGCTRTSCHDPECVGGANRWMLRKHKIQSMNNTGGRLENEASSIGGKNVALTVPAGALSGVTDIACTELEEDELATPVLHPALSSFQSAYVALTPHGQTFASPVTIELPFNQSTAETGYVVVRLADEEDGAWVVHDTANVTVTSHTTPGVKVASVVSSSFSVYAVVTTVAAPTAAPTSLAPSVVPTIPLTSVPTTSPTTWVPTHSPTTAAPTAAPTTAAPTSVPTNPPTSAPTTPPTSAAPTSSPTSAAPTSSPTSAAPTSSPTTHSPTHALSTGNPTVAPSTAAPSSSPTTSSPTSAAPTSAPTTAAPTSAPTTDAPTSTPTTDAPTSAPSTAAPTTATPTTAPTASPHASPTMGATSAPSASPHAPPTGLPTGSPTTSPSTGPTAAPTSAPNQAPSEAPTAAPTLPPTTAPTGATLAPTSPPTGAPSLGPTYGISYLTSTISFSDMSYQDMDAAALAQFQSLYMSQMADSAGVDVSDVKVLGYSAGSTAVTSAITFTDATAATSFSSLLSSNAGAVFTDSGFAAYGSVSLVSVAIGNVMPSDSPTASPTEKGITFAPTSPPTSAPTDTPTHFPTGTPTAPPTMAPTPPYPAPPLPLTPPGIVISPPPPSPPPAPLVPAPPPIIEVQSLSYEEYDAELIDEGESAGLEPVVVPPDTSPPVMTLVGEEEVAVFQLEEYLDAGATAYDARDGALPVTVGGVDAIVTTAVTPRDSPFVVTYTSTDQAGNVGMLQRRVRVNSPCLPPSYLCLELEVPACATCAGATVDTCACLPPAVEEEVVEVEVYVPPPDSTPPVMTLLGDGQLASTSEGVLIMIEEVLVQSTWEHAGVTAFDDKDGNITSKVASKGVSAVNTATATPATAPFVITYSVSDAAGNAAATVRRRVVVYNPCAGKGEDGEDEYPCPGGTEAEPACTTGGLCATFKVEEKSERVKEPPTITLLGPRFIEILVGDPYAACTKFSPLTEICDKGASAQDPKDGVLDASVTACSKNLVTQRFSKKGISACRIDTAVSGEYNITFGVVNSAGLNATVTRTLKIRSLCPRGEFLCLDGISCSERGVCSADLAGGAAVVEVVVDQPPLMYLINSSVVPEYLSLKRGTAYEACAPGQAPSLVNMCEPGPVALDNEDGDITANVLACAPAACLGFGCPAFKFADKGMAGCLNERARVGTIFEVRFVVFDSALPPNNATATRTVTIAAPCDATLAAEKFYCDYGDTWECSPISCEALAQMRELLGTVDTVPPVIHMVNDTLRVLYNEPVDASLAPCPSAAAFDPEGGAACWAYAWDAVDGDVSSTLKISQMNTGGPSCAYSTVVTAQCAPGRYQYRFEAEDAEGNVGYNATTVLVLEQAAVTVSGIFATGASSRAAAQLQASDWLDPSSDTNAVVRQSIADMLNARSSPAEGMQTVLGDVAITEVNVIFSASSGFQLNATYTIQVYTAGESSARRFRRLRALLQETTGQLASKASELADLLGQAFDPAAGASESIGTYLAASSAARNVTAVAANATGLGGEATAAVLTDEVDPLKAMQAQVTGLVSSMKTQQVRLEADMAELETSTSLADASFGLIKQAVEGVWEEGLVAAAEQVQDHIDQVAQALENVNQFVTNMEDMQVGMESIIALQNEQAEALVLFEESMSNISAMLKEVELDNIAAAQSWDAAATTLQLCDRRNPGGTKDIRFDLNELYFSPPPPPPSDPPPSPSSPVAPGASSVVEEVESANATATRRLLARGRSRGNADGEEDSGEAIDTSPGDFLGYTLPGGDPGYRLPAQFRMSRYVANNHRLVGGIIVVASGRRQGRCTRRFTIAGAPCVTGEPVDGRYGVDPVFYEHTSLFKAELAKNVHRFYDTTSGYHCNDVTSGDELCKPRPFYKPDKPFAGMDGYPVMLDASITGNRAKEIFTLMREGGYINSLTRKIEVKYMTFNADEMTFSMNHLEFLDNGGGMMTVKMENGVLRTRKPVRPGDGAGGWANFGGLLQYSMYVLWVCIIAVKVVNSLRRRWFSTRDATDWSSFVYLWIKPRRKVHWVWGLLDLMTLAVQVCALIAIAKVVHMSFNQLTEITAFYDVYDNRYSYANFLLPARIEADDARFLSHGGDPAATEFRWQLPEDPEPWDRMSKDILALEQALAYEDIFWKLQGLSVVALLARLLKDMDFQPRLRFMNDTFRLCMMDLLHFLAVMLYMLMVNGVVLNVIIGWQVQSCSTFLGSQTMSFELIPAGAFDVKGMVEPGASMWTVVEWLPVILSMYFVPLLISWCALNFLLGIIGDAYAEVKDQFGDAKDIFVEGSELFTYYLLGAGFAPANYDGQLRMFRESGVDLDSDDEDGDGGSDAPLDPNDLQDLQKKYNMLLRDVKASIQRKTLRAVQVCRDPNELAKKLDDASKAGAVESKISGHDALALMSVLMEDGRGSFRGAYRKQLLYEQELEGQNEEGETKMRPRLQKFVNNLSASVKTLNEALIESRSQQEALILRYDALVQEVAPDQTKTRRVLDVIRKSTQDDGFDT